MRRRTFFGAMIAGLVALWSDLTGKTTRAAVARIKARGGRVLKIGEPMRRVRIPDLPYPDGPEAATCNYPGDQLLVPRPLDGACCWVRQDSGQLEFAIPKVGDVFFSHGRFWRLKRAFIAKGNIRTDEHLEIAAAEGHVEPVPPPDPVELCLPAKLRENEDRFLRTALGRE